ncbi:ATP-binding cassette domain-containing protein, partial [bacterium]
VISMAAMVTVSASVIPALKASTIATPQLPLKWKLDHVPSKSDMWLLHVPQLISQPELRRFFRFIKGRFDEMQLLRAIPEKMELRDIVDESDQGRDVRKLLFAYSFAQEGSRAFRTENELVASRDAGSSTYAVDLVIRIAMLYNYQPSEVVMKTAKAVRRLMLQWAATPSSERWGQTAELVRLEGLSVVSNGEEVLRDINMSIMRGEIVGLMGEGRRALILAMAGLCKPSSGSALLGGMDTYSRRDETKDAIGTLLQGTELYEGFSLRWNLRFLAKLEGRADVEVSANKILERCNLSQHADEGMSSLSSGARRRAMIAQTLIKDVSLLLMEDPFTGLREDEAKGIVALLMDLNRSEGITIVCTGRNAGELAFCNRILALENHTLDMKAEGRGEANG